MARLTMFDADLLIAAELQAVEHLRRANQRHAAARHDSLFDSGLRRVHRVFDACLFLFHLAFGCRPDLDHGDAPNELREPLLQFLSVVVRRRVLDLRESA